MKHCVFCARDRWWDGKAPLESTSEARGKRLAALHADLESDERHCDRERKGERRVRVKAGAGWSVRESERGARDGTRASCWAIG